ncbi:MAG: UMP kinase [Clostridiales bacterium]|jgi:uridylate kinase|nr:UMP kinase [Clostridiales bacterium]
MYTRVLLKLSGGALGTKDELISGEMLCGVAGQLMALQAMGVKVGVVLGGGNILRGRAAKTMQRNRADQLGMLATVINALALQDTLLNMRAGCTVLSAVEMPRFCDTYTYRGLEAALEADKIVIFAAGTGHPFFSTDTTAALRAAQMGAEIMLLAKNIDGVYSADPKLDPNAIRYDTLTPEQVLSERLRATDLTAITLCDERNIPILVFGLNEKDGILRAVKGERVGTLIKR